MIDQELNINTEGYLRVNNRIGYAEYDATPYDILQKMVERYPFEPQDCFIDFGCGKGRTLFYAAICGCESVIGIEYSAKIYKMLLKNIDNCNVYSNITVKNEKAEESDIDVRTNKCFFYNPFYLKYFIKVYKNILLGSNRPIIYFFLFDAANEYRRYLEIQKNVRLDSVLKADDGRNLYVYVLER